MSGRDCKHGHLARSCEVCEMERTIAELRNALAGQYAEEPPAPEGMNWDSATAHEDNMRWQLGRYYDLNVDYHCACVAFWVSQVSIALMIVRELMR